MKDDWWEIKDGIVHVPYRARVRLEPDGPIYVLRFHGDRAIFTADFIAVFPTVS